MPEGRGVGALSGVVCSERRPATACRGSNPGSCSKLSTASRTDATPGPDRRIDGGMNPELTSLLADGVVAAREHPHLSRCLNSCAFRGELIRLLPGVYAKPLITTRDLDRAPQGVCAYERTAAGHHAPGRRTVDLVAGTRSRRHHRRCQPHRDQDRGRVPIRATAGPPGLDDPMLRPEGDSARAHRPRPDRRPRRRRDRRGAPDAAPSHASPAAGLRLTPGRRGNQLRMETPSRLRGLAATNLVRPSNDGAPASRCRAEQALEARFTNYRIDIGTDTFLLDVALPRVRPRSRVRRRQVPRHRRRLPSRPAEGQGTEQGGWQIVRFTSQGLDDSWLVRHASSHPRAA